MKTYEVLNIIMKSYLKICCMYYEIKYIKSNNKLFKKSNEKSTNQIVHNVGKQGIQVLYGIYVCLNGFCME